jgi:hypothetical protein
MLTLWGLNVESLKVDGWNVERLKVESLKVDGCLENL